MNDAGTRRPIGESRSWRAYHRRRYAILFYALLLTLMVMPIVTAIGLPAVLLRLLLTASLFAAVMPSATRRTRSVLFSGLVLLAFARSASERGLVDVDPALVLILVGLTGLAAAAGALRFAVLSPKVDSETVHAALSTYLLAGLFFGQIYLSIEAIRPGSFVGPDPVTEATAVYYSFVTLATLGYGDYVPRTDIARGVAMFEVVSGQLFLAVLVARLIGAFGIRHAND